MKTLRLAGGTGRQIHLLLTVMTTLVIVASACSSGGTERDQSVAWSADPCGLAPPQDVLAAFGTTPTAVATANPGECRYRLGETLLRIVVLADNDSCSGAIRSYEALGNTVAHPDDAPAGIFTADPAGDVIVCDDEATYVMSADASTQQLIELAGTSPSHRSD